MMTLHEFANVATLQLFDDEISLDATHLYLNSSHGEGSIRLDGNVYVNGEPLTGLETRTLLWTNASPSSAFAAQTLDSSDGIPDLSEYDSIAVVCKVHTSNSQYFEERGPLGGQLTVSALYSATSSVYRFIDSSMSEIYVGAPAGAAGMIVFSFIMNLPFKIVFYDFI